MPATVTDYIVEQADGHWLVVPSTPTRVALRIAPRMSDGAVNIDGHLYTIDTRRMRRFETRLKRYAFMVSQETRVQLWKEGNPQPVDLFSIDADKSDDGGMSGRIQARVHEADDVRDLVHPSANILLFVAIAGVALAIGAFVLAGFLASKVP